MADNPNIEDRLDEIQGWCFAEEYGNTNKVISPGIPMILEQITEVLHDINAKLIELDSKLNKLDNKSNKG